MKNKMTAVFATLMIALMAAGFTYATWKDYVQIEGTVYMGELIVGIQDVKWVWDNEPYLPAPKDVANCTYELFDNETSKHHIPPETVYHTMVITVNNAYPSYWQVIKFNLKNAGTIPAHIISVDIYDPEGVLIWNDTDTKEIIMVPGEEPFNWTDVANDGVGDFCTSAGIPVINFGIIKYDLKTGRFVPLVCNQLEPCTAEPVYLWLHIKQPAEECHTYRFKIHIEAIQWNEYVPPP